MMEAIKGGGVGGGGGGKVGVGHEEDMGDGLRCSNHPYRKNPGGICAFCLQEKLGKLLVSSSIPSSSSSSSSFRSDINGGLNNADLISASSSSSLSLSIRSTSTKSLNDNVSDCNHHDARRARIPFLFGKKNNKIMGGSSSISSNDRTADIVLRRSKSTATPRRGQFLDPGVCLGDYSPRKRGGFWSFFYPSASKSQRSKKMEKGFRARGSSDLGENSTILEDEERTSS